MDMFPNDSDDSVATDLAEWSTPVLRRAALEDTAYGSGCVASDFCTASASVSTPN
jgi:hypothetical protein